MVERAGGPVVAGGGGGGPPDQSTVRLAFESGIVCFGGCPKWCGLLAPVVGAVCAVLRS